MSDQPHWESSRESFWYQRIYELCYSKSHDTAFIHHMSMGFDPDQPCFVSIRKLSPEIHEFEFQQETFSEPHWCEEDFEYSGRMSYERAVLVYIDPNRMARKRALKEKKELSEILKASPQTNKKRRAL